MTPFEAREKAITALVDLCCGPHRTKTAFSTQRVATRAGLDPATTKEALEAMRPDGVLKIVRFGSAYWALDCG